MSKNIKSVNTEAVIKELHRAFKLFNETLFNSELPEPAILIQSRGNKKLCLGWCSVHQIWKDEATQEEKYEINLVAEAINRGLYPVMSTLLHEMVHLHNLVKGIKDTSRGNTYHNIKFKEVAESHGLTIEHADKIGWSLSQLQPSTMDLIDKAEINGSVFTFGRMDAGEGEEKKKKKSSVRKYVCPVCGQIIRATKEVNVYCGDCMESNGEIVKFIWEKPEDWEDENPTENPTEEPVEEPVEEPTEAPVEEPVEEEPVEEEPVEELHFEDSIEAIKLVCEDVQERAEAEGFDVGRMGSLEVTINNNNQLWGTYKNHELSVSSVYLTEATNEEAIKTIEHLFVHHLLFTLEGEKPSHNKRFKEVCEMLGVDSTTHSHPKAKRPVR